MKSRFRYAAMLAVLLVFPTPSPAQDYSGIGRSVGNEVLGAAAGVLAVTLLVVYLINHERQASVTGCVQSAGDKSTLINETDKRNYTLVGVGANQVSPGSRVTLKGKRIRQPDGSAALRVKSVVNNAGACTP
jgi:hypothetical protein